MNQPDRVRVGATDELMAKGQLTAKLGSQPVCVFWSEGRAYAVDDRCPHMGFPLHRGTVENGLLTCHWHHARFDLQSGGTLDPFADDVRSYPVLVDGEDVLFDPSARGDAVAYWRHRLEQGMEQTLSLVIAKAVLALLAAAVPVDAIVAVAGAHGLRYRGAGWGTGMTILTALANILPLLDPDDQALALIHGI